MNYHESCPTYREFHALSSCSPQLAANNNLTAFCTTLHNKPKNTVAGSSNCQTVQQLVAQTLTLCYGAQAPILHLSSIERHAVFGELEPLLYEGGELADTATLLSKNFLGMRSANDDVGDSWSDADLDTRIAFFGKFSLEELV